MSEAHKDALIALYGQYSAARGRPGGNLTPSGLPTPVDEAVFQAYIQVQDKGRLRSLRQSLKLAANQCPYCGFGEIADLDHHLQKRAYPWFSIFALNLVPACAVCNRHKPKKPRVTLGKHHVHAYLDDVPPARFLRADATLEDGALVVQFRIDNTAALEPEMAARLEQHLKDFRLNERYPAQVTTHLGNLLTSLRQQFDAGGSDAVREYLAQCAEGSLTFHGPNDWRQAMLEAVAACNEFCDGGFLSALGVVEAQN